MTMIRQLLAICLLAIPMSVSALTIIDEANNARLTTKKVINIKGTMNREMVARVAQQYAKVFKLPRDLVLIFDSGGGKRASGDLIIDMIETTKKRGVGVTCIADGRLYSMAFNAFMHCDTRLTTARTSAMFHKIYFYTWPYPHHPVVNIEYLQKALKDLRETNRPYKLATMKAMKLTEKEYDYHAKYETYWTPAQLLKIGYFHKLVRLEK